MWPAQRPPAATGKLRWAPGARAVVWVAEKRTAKFKVNVMNGSECAFGYLDSKCTRFNSTQKDSNTAQFSESFVHLSN